MYSTQGGDEIGPGWLFSGCENKRNISAHSQQTGGGKRRRVVRKMQRGTFIFREHDK